MITLRVHVFSDMYVCIQKSHSRRTAIKYEIHNSLNAQRQWQTQQQRQAAQTTMKILIENISTVEISVNSFQLIHFNLDGTRIGLVKIQLHMSVEAEEEGMKQRERKGNKQQTNGIVMCL